MLQRRHDLLHPANILRYVVSIVLARVIHPLRLRLVEVVLIVGREPARLTECWQSQRGGQEPPVVRISSSFRTSQSSSVEEAFFNPELR